ncbi:glycosyltransferase family 4 protein [Clostridium omnivorum]|uniref:Glycosyl transferase n=1 Tax=Clostridium omnivorum TaxID=1604902 RepID=A0ABQ5N1Y2_9CLOT|nr:glycosyltransferase family 4 protein [Clostridium sp. E14]GLC29219.1 glycosyl transferase [Clostridium sp. E14]
MKVLITTDTYYPMINGVVISINNLYKELKRQGHDVRIMALSSTGEECINGDVYYLKSLKTGIYPDARFRIPFTGNLIKQLLEWKPDIIHSQTEFSTLFAAKYIAKKLNIPQIHTYHTLYEDYLTYIMNGKLINKRTNAAITRYMLNSMDGVVVPTKKVDKVIKGYGVKTNMFIVPTGIDISRFKKKVSMEEKRSMLQELNLTEEDNIIVYIGRIAEEKNIEEVMEYFAAARDKIEKLKLVIVGGGPYLEILREKASKLNLQPDIRFVGMVSPEETYKYYQLGQVFATASTSETQGLTYIEALASSLPVVCRYDSCVDGLIVNNETGFTYTNEQEFTSYMTRIFYDNELRKRLSSGAIKMAEEYSAENFGQNISNVYLKNYSKCVDLIPREVKIKNFIRHAVVRR